jgi:hypothetical protein
MAWSSYHAVIILEGVRAALTWSLEQSTFQSSTSGAFLCVEGLLLVWALGGAARILGTKGGKSGSAAKAGLEKGAASAQEAGTLQLVLAEPCGPSREPFASNALEARSFETDVCTGKFLLLHKPTTEPERLKCGDYPYAGHMQGRKRNFEVRIQICFKSVESLRKGKVYFGCELDRFYNIGAIELYFGRSLNDMIKRCAKGHHQSYGDDPDRVAGELERPCNVFPLWVMDQLVVTPVGEKPPELTSDKFPELGMIKANDRKAMSNAIDELEFQVGVTYTFGFWCVSQFADGIKWKATLGGPLDTSLSALGTHPPAYMSMYCVKPREEWTDVRDSRDQRHLDSRKEYIFRAAFWSSLHPPPPKRVKELTSAKLAAEPEWEPPVAPKESRCCCCW